MTIGFGIVTTPNRVDYFKQSWTGVEQFVAPVVDDVLFQIDGLYEGVGTAKNKLLARMLERGFDWLLISEDDVVADSPRAVTGYVEVAERAKLHHLSFAHHGPRNVGNGGVVFPNQGISLWPNSVGAWCLYSRACLEAVGLMDEGFPKNCLEHVEHSCRIDEWERTVNPFMSPMKGFADAATSRDWLHEIPGSFDNPADPIASSRLVAGKAYWKANHPTTYLWGDN